MGSSSVLWRCVRQRAGPLVKECRALRPRFSPADSAADRRAKAQLRPDTRTAVNRRLMDRFELWLALLGWDGTHYILTYDDEHLPPDFGALRRSWRAFLGRVSRWRGGTDLPYAYRIEGLHGDKRYHIHFACRYGDLSPTEVRALWRNGEVDDEPVLRTRPVRDPESGEWYKVSDGGFRRLAEYFCKERVDGCAVPLNKHPWGCSKPLRALLPPPEKWDADSGAIDIPADVLWARRGSTENDFGAYYFGSWIESTH